MVMMKSVVLMAVVHAVFLNVQCIKVVSAFAPPRPVAATKTAATGIVSTRSAAARFHSQSSSEESNECDNNHHHHHGVGHSDVDGSSSGGGGVSADRRSFINNGLVAATTAAAASVFVPTMTRPAYASGGTRVNV